MSRSRNFSMVGCVVCLAGLYIFHREAVRLQTIQSEEAELRHESSHIGTELQNVRARQAGFDRNLDLLRKQEADKKSASVRKSDADFDSAAQVRRQAARNRAKLRLQFQPLYQALHLTDQQAAQVTALYSDFMARRADILIAAQAQGLTRADPAIDDMVQKELDSLKASITDIIGPDGFQLWQDYRRTGPIYGLEQLLAANLYFTAAPLSAEQAAQLTPLLVPLSPTFGAPRGPYDVTTVEPAKLQAVAGKVLSGTQLSALETLQSSLQALSQQNALLSAWGAQNSDTTANGP